MTIFASPCCLSCIVRSRYHPRVSGLLSAPFLHPTLPPPLPAHPLTLSSRPVSQRSRPFVYDRDKSRKFPLDGAGGTFSSQLVGREALLKMAWENIFYSLWFRGSFQCCNSDAVCFCWWVLGGSIRASFRGVPGPGMLENSC